MEQHILLARQPIYRKDLSLYGFELLFRSQHHLSALDIGEDKATYEVLVNYSTSISHEIDNSKYPLFVNISESFLCSEEIFSMEKERVVLELLERIEVNEQVIEAVKRLNKAGYKLALDDYDFDPRWEPLIPYVDIIKVDVLEADMAEVERAMNAVSGFDGQWLAERIEDQALLERCIELGFKLFQGYVLAKPKAVLGNKIQGSTAVTTEIIRLTSDPEVELSVLADQVAKDPKLSIQLLKLINSPLVNLNREVSDLTQAISFLGIDMLKRWAMMIAFVANSSAPMESNRIILTRAKCCELYFADHERWTSLAPSAFLVGLISGVDVLLELDPKFFVQQIQFSSEIQNAILNAEGDLASVLNQARLIEFFLTQAHDKIEEIPEQLLNYYGEAQQWAGEVIDSLR